MLEEPFLKDAGLLGLPLGCPLRDVVCFLFGAPGHVLQLQAQELLLHLAHLREVCLHVFVLRLVYLVGEVDEELLMALDDKALYP